MPSRGVPLTAFAVGALVWFAAPASAQQTKGTARIRGTVSTADTGRPIRRATVRLISLDKRPNENTTTDANGRFEFSELVAGKYRVTAARGGFVPLSYGQNPSGEGPDAIDLAAGERFDRADIRLPRGGVLAGRVFDEYGEPVPEARIQVYRADYTLGVRRLVAVRSAASNDIGEFRAYGLATGTYYVSGTSGTSIDTGPLAFWNAPSGTMVFAPTFYPGSVLATDARPIPVEAGQEIANLEFALRPVRLARISGRVVDSRGRTLTLTSVNLVHARRDGVVVGSISATRTGPGGEFSFGGLAPGDYRIQVIATIDAAAGPRSAAGEREYGSATVSVGGEDVEGLHLTTGPGHTLSGRVVAEGGVLEAASLEGLSINLEDADGAVAESGVKISSSAGVRQDGTFEAGGLFGTRLIRVRGLPDGWALKSVRVGGHEVADAGVEIRGAITDVEVVVSGNPSTVGGRLFDSQGRPVGERTIAVFPEDQLRWTGHLNRYVVSARTTADGSFAAGALPPGSYYAAVIESRDGEWRAPENLERLRATATRFTLADGEKKALRLVLR